MPRPPVSSRTSPLAVLLAVTLAVTLGACSARQTETPTTAAKPAESPPPPTLTSDMVVTLTWFDKAQGATVSRDWLKAHDAMAAMGGYQYSALFTSMDWERESNAMALSLWDDPEAALSGLRVAEAQLPARGWAKTGVYHRIAGDGEMGDSLYRSIVMVLPITASMDSAQAVADFQTTSAFMKQQPGYIASLLLENQAGSSEYGHVISARWASREAVKRAADQDEFRAIVKRSAIVGLPTTYLQLMYSGAN